MRRPTIVAAVLVVVVLALGSTFFVGGVLGFFYGFGFHDSLTAPAEGTYTVTVLRRLRAGDTNEAIKLLELQLDGQVVEHTVYRDAPPLLGVFNVLDLGRHNTKFLGIIASYRAQFSDAGPPSASYPHVSQAVAEALAPYAPNPTPAE